MPNKEDILKRAAQMAEQGMAPQPAPPVQPQPVPLGIQIGQGTMPDGKLAVVFVIYSPTGQAVYFFDADTAKQVGQDLQRVAGAASAGLVVPG